PRGRDGENCAHVRSAVGALAGRGGSGCAPSVEHMHVLAVAAGLVSTVIFAGSMLPMVVKAVGTRDLSSYSLSHLVLVNSGIALYSFYVYSLPLGPIWALHTFHLSTSVVMLIWYLRFAEQSQTPPTQPRSSSRRHCTRQP